MGRFGAAELLLLLIPGLVLYFVPAIIAISRNHTNKAGILLLNIFLGWTFVGWIASFIWSLSATGKQTIVVNNHHAANDHRVMNIHQSVNTESKKTEEYADKIERLQKLKQLLDTGILSEEEFAKEKARILQH